MKNMASGGSNRITQASFGLLAMFALTAHALAEPNPSPGGSHAVASSSRPSPAERETARSAMDEGDRLRGSGDLRGALDRFLTAHAIMRLPTTGLEVARSQVQLGMLVEARQTALDAARLPPVQGERAVITAARKMAAALAEDIVPRVPALTTRVVPPDVPYSLTVDSVRVPEASRTLPFESNPGEHEIVVEAEGYQPIAQRLVLLEGSDRVVQVTLIPLPRPAEASVLAARSARLDLGSKRDDPASDDRLRGIIALGVGGATLAVGVITGVASLVETGNAKGECEGKACPARAWDQVETANTLANISNVTIPLGLLGIAYGVYEFLTLPTEAPAARVRSTRSLVVSVRPDGASATWRGAL